MQKVHICCIRWTSKRLKRLQLQGASPLWPPQGALPPGLPLGAPPLDPRYRLALPRSTWPTTPIFSTFLRPWVTRGGSRTFSLGGSGVVGWPWFRWGHGIGTTKGLQSPDMNFWASSQNGTVHGSQQNILITAIYCFLCVIFLIFI